jgi:predicted dehydrogenase
MDIDALMDAEKRSGVPVSVGYMKRHDPIVARFVRHIREHAGTARRISVTINDPNSPEQIEHLLPRFVSGVRRYSPDQAAAVERALGPDAHPVQREVYARGLGGSLIHQVNIVQEALSWHGLELLNRLRLCSQWARGTAVACQWQPADGLMVEMSHARLPEHRTYRERIECVGERSVATLRMPSPYSRDLGASLDIDTWDATGVCRSDRFTAVPGRTGFRMQLRSWAKSLAGDPDVAMPGLSEARRDVEILREAALAVS